VLSKKLRFRSPVLLITAWQLLLGTPLALVVWLLLHGHTYLHPAAGRELFGLFYWSSSPMRWPMPCGFLWWGG
jgi:hypothetical protein